VVARDLKLMDAPLFAPQPFGLQLPQKPQRTPHG
jgi:propionate CoA-transferase